MCLFLLCERQIMFPTITIFGTTIYTYTPVITIGIGLAVVLAVVRAKRAGLPRQDVFNALLIALVGLLIGAKVLFILSMLPQIIKHPELLLACLLSGFTYYGGLIGALIGMLIYLKKYKLPVLPYADLIAPSIALAHAIGRIGCFLVGCCYGCETDSVIGITFTHAIGGAPSGIKLVPTQLIESSCNFLLCALLLLYARSKPRGGRIIAVYLIGYGIIRFVIEFFRADYRGEIWVLSISQYISILAILGGIILFFKKNKNPETL